MTPKDVTEKHRQHVLHFDEGISNEKGNERCKLTKLHVLAYKHQIWKRVPPSVVHNEHQGYASVSVNICWRGPCSAPQHSLGLGRWGFWDRLCSTSFSAAPRIVSVPQSWRNYSHFFSFLWQKMPPPRRETTCFPPNQPLHLKPNVFKLPYIPTYVNRRGTRNNICIFFQFHKGNELIISWAHPLSCCRHGGRASQCCLRQSPSSGAWLQSQLPGQPWEDWHGDVWHCWKSPRKAVVKVCPWLLSSSHGCCPWLSSCPVAVMSTLQGCSHLCCECQICAFTHPSFLPSSAIQPMTKLFSEWIDVEGGTNCPLTSEARKAVTAANKCMKDVISLPAHSPHAGTMPLQSLLADTPARDSCTEHPYGVWRGGNDTSLLCN